MSDEALYREATLAELFSGQKASPVYSVKYVVPVEPDYEVTYCPVHDVTWPVNHERCGLIVLAHYPEADDE